MSGRRSGAIALYALALLALGATFVLLGPPTGHDAVLIGGLAALSAIAYWSQIALEASIPATFDAAIIAALLTLQVAGPLFAFMVIMIPDLIDRVILRRHPVRSSGLLSTAVAAGWALLVGAAVLALAGNQAMPGAAPALFSAGLAVVLTAFLLGPLLSGWLYDREAPGAVVRAQLLPLLPALLGMLGIATIIAVLIPLIGALALVGFGAVVAVPPLAVRLATPRGSVAALDRGQAAATFAAMIADEVAVDRRERRVLAAAAQSRFGTAEPLSRFTFVRQGDLSGVFITLLHAEERWDGTGQPGRISATSIPLTSRILAVAEGWANLTARGGPGLSHTEALLDMAARAGSELDPELVAAAGYAVARERSMPGPETFEPRLHRLPLPRPLRRALPHVAARLGPPTPVG